MSVTVRLEDDVDVSRGDMICRPQNAPRPSQDIDAMICWMSTNPLQPRQKLAIKHTTRTARTMIKDVQYRLDVNSLHRDLETKELGAQRDRPGPAAHDRAVALRPVREEPHHRFVHPDRRSDRRHRRRRDDPLRQPNASVCSQWWRPTQRRRDGPLSRLGRIGEFA